MTFFFDRNISVHIARMMGHFERAYSVVHLDDDNRFKPTDTDIKIVTTLAQDDPPPIWITADVNQRRNPVERAALGSSGMTIVFFKAGFHKVSFHRQAIGVLNIWPELVKQTIRCKQPSVFEITPACRKVDFVCLTADLLKKLRGK